MYSWKMIKKIKNIIIGWYTHFFKTKSEFSKQRLEICMKCPHRTQVLGEDICSLCYCVCKVKVTVEDETCYDGRWNEIKINEYDK